MVDKSYVRRHYIVNKRFQYSFIARAVLITAISFIVAFLAIIVYFCLEYGFKSMFENRIFIQVIGGVKVENIISPFKLIMLPFIISAIVVMTIVFIFSMLYSNRIAGPIYRFRFILAMYINGDYNVNINLRKRDEFKELAEDFNKYSKIMRNLKKN